jgi:L-rhamnose mutarotase
MGLCTRNNQPALNKIRMNLKSGYPQSSLGQTKRYCQYLQLNPETVEEYTYWHKNIWKEIPEGIRKVGILNMEIYLVEDKSFMIIDTPLDFDWDEAFGRLATLERQAEWEDFVSKFQESEPGKHSEEKWQLMERVFSLCH